jgi:aminopeptidase N
MSYRFPAWPFPFSHETVVDGLDEMEYPMLVNAHPRETRQGMITLVDHEIIHAMFPFYMGINETKYSWMDEGWATFGEWLISPMIDSTFIDDLGISLYNTLAGTDIDLPVTTLTTQLGGSNALGGFLYLDSYPKPGLGYLYAKDMLGDSLFLKGLHYYISQWHGKHPIPMDFFNCMNAGTGRNLNWFWKRWFFDNGYPDLAIARVDESGKRPRVTVELKGEKPVPIHLTVYNVDNTIDRIHYDVSCWEKGNTSFAFDLESAKPFRKLVLGDVYDADVNKKDNVFERQK